MCSLIIANKILYIKLFIVFTFFIGLSSLPCLSDLKAMCCIDSGTKEIKSMPSDSHCTAIAEYSFAKHQNIDPLKGCLKFVYIYNDYGYDTLWTTITEDMEYFVDLFSNLIEKRHIDIFIIKNLYRPSTASDPGEGYDSEFQTYIYTLFDILKKRNPNTLFGLVLRAKPDLGFNITYLDEVVPFFLLRSFDYHKCNRHKSQSTMHPAESVEDIEESIKLVLCQLNKAKLAIVIRVIVKTTTGGNAPKEDDESYTHYCDHKTKKRRRFCVETLTKFYLKGHLIPKYNLVGALIQSYDRDDYEGKCGCGLYPVMSAINAGLQGLPEPLHLTKCPNWTILPNDRYYG